MKKTRFVAMVLAVAVMLIGAGYAAWTDTLIITNTVSTGNLDVDMDTGSVYVYPTASAETPDGITNRTAKAELTGEDEVTVTITNLYPNAKAVVTIPVINDSSIPVKVNKFETVDLPEWLAILDQYCPPSLDVNDSDNIVLTLVVADDNVPENATATFTTTAIYEQFNAD
jgi:predicted ribosomally synthesized peptide with SipW-like signal peptide